MSVRSAAGPREAPARRERSRRDAAQGEGPQPPRRARSRSTETRAALLASIAAAQKARARDAAPHRGAAGCERRSPANAPLARARRVTRARHRRSWTHRWRSGCCRRSPAARRGASWWCVALPQLPACAAPCPHYCPRPAVSPPLTPPTLSAAAGAGRLRRERRHPRAGRLQLRASGAEAQQRQAIRRQVRAQPGHGRCGAARGAALRPRGGGHARQAAPPGAWPLQAPESRRPNRVAGTASDARAVRVGRAL